MIHILSIILAVLALIIACVGYGKLEVKNTPITYCEMKNMKCVPDGKGIYCISTIPIIEPRWGNK